MKAEWSGKKKLPLPAKIAIAVVTVVLVLVAGAYGLFNHYYHQMNIQKASGYSEEEISAEEEYFETEENTGDLEELDPDSIQLDSATAAKTNKEVVNILLCGV